MDIANPTEEHAMLRSMIRDWVEEYVEPQAFEHDKKELFNLDLLKSMGELGLLGISAPEEYGGAGLDAAACAIVHEELSASDPGFALAYLAHSMLFVNNLAYNGNEEQKTRILPKVCSGEWIGAMAMSEPDAGTDVLGLATNAEQQPDGSWKLNGRKMWITNGPDASTLIVYAKTNEDLGSRGITAFIIEKEMEGFRTEKKLDKLGMRGSNTCELVFENCEVPFENILGEEGKGVEVLMSGLDYERVVLAAGPLGIMASALDVVIPYVHERKQFGQPIGNFQLIQAKIADMYTTFSACKSYVYRVADACDRGNITRKDSAGCILYSAEKATQLALEAIQCLGGNGYTNDYPTGRLLRDAKLYEIGAGTSEIRRILIGREIFEETK